MDFTIGKKIDPILERYYKKEIDLLEVRKELVILFNNELEQKLNIASVVRPEVESAKAGELLPAEGLEKSVCVDCGTECKTYGDGVRQYCNNCFPY